MISGDADVESEATPITDEEEEAVVSRMPLHYSHAIIRNSDRRD